MINVFLCRMYSNHHKTEFECKIVDLLGSQTEEEWKAHEGVEVGQTHLFHMNLLHAMEDGEANRVFNCVNQSKLNVEKEKKKAEVTKGVDSFKVYLPSPLIPLNSTFLISLKAHPTPFSGAFQGFTQEHKNMILRFNKFNVAWIHFLSLKDQLVQNKGDKTLHPKDLLSLMQSVYFYRKDQECPWDPKYIIEFRRRITHSEDYDIFTSWTQFELATCESDELKTVHTESSCLLKATLSLWGWLDFSSCTDPTTNEQRPILHKGDPQVIPEICKVQHTTPSLSALQSMIALIETPLKELQTSLLGAFTFTSKLDYLISTLSVSVLQLIKTLHVWFRPEFYNTLQDTIAKTPSIQLKWQEIETKEKQILVKDTITDQHRVEFINLQRKKQSLLDDLYQIINESNDCGDELEFEITQADMLYQATRGSMKMKVRREKKTPQVKRKKVDIVDLDKECEWEETIDPESSSEDEEEEEEKPTGNILKDTHKKIKTRR